MAEQFLETLFCYVCMIVRCLLLFFFSLPAALHVPVTFPKDLLAIIIIIIIIIIISLANCFNCRPRVIPSCAHRRFYAFVPCCLTKVVLTSGHNQAFPFCNQMWDVLGGGVVRRVMKSDCISIAIYRQLPVTEFSDLPVKNQNWWHFPIPTFSNLKLRAKCHPALQIQTFEIGWVFINLNPHNP